MDPLTMMALMSGSQAVGAGIGSLFGPDYESIYGDLSIPDVQTLINAGKLDGTAYDQITEDPQTRAAQMEALSNLQNLGRAGGMDLQAQVAQQQGIDRAAQADKANRDAVLNQMSMRGMGGSGVELAGQLSGQQQMANANAMGSAQAASDARNRALQAMMGSAQLGGSIRGQDYGIASDRASARDRIAQFNAQNAQNAYANNMNWQLAKAGGRAGLAGQQGQAATNQGGGWGSLAGMGGALALQQMGKKKPEEEAGWTAWPK